MKRTLLTTLLAPALLLAGACQDSPTSPPDSALDHAQEVPAPSFELRTTDGMSALLWETPLKSDVTVRKIIEDDGGRIWAAPGIRLVFPVDALKEETRITIRSHAGEDVAFEFGPHGLEFDRMVKVQIELDALKNRHELIESAKMAVATGEATDPNRIRLGSLTAIYYATQDGQLVETLQTFDVFLVNGMYVEFETDHFSGYALAA